MPEKEISFLTGSWRRDERKRADLLELFASQRQCSGIEISDYANMISIFTCPRAPRRKTGRARAVTVRGALASLLTKTRVRSDVRWTANQLRGRVMRVGASRRSFGCRAFGSKSSFARAKQIRLDRSQEKCEISSSHFIPAHFGTHATGTDAEMSGEDPRSKDPTSRTSKIQTPVCAQDHRRWF